MTPTERFLPEPLRARLRARARPVPGVPGMHLAPGLREDFPDLETEPALRLVARITRELREAHGQLLRQRAADRAAIDARTRELAQEQAGGSFADPGRQTVIGHRDAQGRVLIGPMPEPPELPPVAVPPALQGEQVTLFGPPDRPSMAIHAMNALHRIRSDEPPLVAELVRDSGIRPRWGADSEDSQTPLMPTLLAATRNLRGCYQRSLVVEEEHRRLELHAEGLSVPIKRIPGLALPDGWHLVDGLPVPLHLYELVSHLWHHRHQPEARVLYFPKLEQEEEAAYLRQLIEHAEAAIKEEDPSCDPRGSRVLLVVESPRAIFRIREMAAALGPCFLGASLGWHDFLAATARVFSQDPAYRIPAKADPDIVVQHIAASHRLLARSLESCGALRIGGMYGVLFQEEDPASFQASMVGYIRDVCAQLRRGLEGFWVAHPDFVRIGIALVTAIRRGQAGETELLPELIRALVPDPAIHRPLIADVVGPDVPELDQEDPRYLRSVLAADLPPSAERPNHHPDSIRHNISQSLQYLAAWLAGTGCVALPATLPGADGQPVPVRVMDDLATTERSRWELWAEVHHGRVARHRFEQLLVEELAGLHRGELPDGRPIQVAWEGETARWYPIAARILRQLATDPEPAEWATELLLPFTLPPVRHAPDPWATAMHLCPRHYRA